MIIVVPAHNFLQSFLNHRQFFHNPLLRQPRRPRIRPFHRRAHQPDPRRRLNRIGRRLQRRPIQSLRFAVCIVQFDEALICEVIAAALGGEDVVLVRVGLHALDGTLGICDEALFVVVFVRLV